MTYNQSDKKLESLGVQKSPPYRRYFCRLCCCEVIICLYCDHHQIYCITCRKISKKEMNKKSNRKYRATFNGKRLRAKSEKIRREKLKNNTDHSTSCKIVGEKAIQNAKVLIVPNDISTPVFGEETNQSSGGLKDEMANKYKESRCSPIGLQTQRGGYKEILCQYCREKCSSYVYNDIISKHLFKKIFEKIRY